MFQFLKRPLEVSLSYLIRANTGVSWERHFLNWLPDKLNLSSKKKQVFLVTEFDINGRKVDDGMQINLYYFIIFP